MKAIAILLGSPVALYLSYLFLMCPQAICINGFGCSSGLECYAKWVTYNTEEIIRLANQ